MALDGEVLESPNWEEGIPTALSEIMDKLCDALDESKKKNSHLSRR